MEARADLRREALRVEDLSKEISELRAELQNFKDGSGTSDGRYCDIRDATENQDHHDGHEAIELSGKNRTGKRRGRSGDENDALQRGLDGARRAASEPSAILRGRLRRR